MSENPWQLTMFNRSLKKRQKLATLRRCIGQTMGKRCLLVTCGDNNGALNYHFRAMGGAWRWADLQDESIPAIERLLGEPVEHVSSDELPYPDASFDVVVSIDVLEHLTDDQPFLRELFRITKPGGVAVVTTPGGDEGKLMNRVKYRVGMTPEQYGHTRLGYTVEELRDSMTRASFRTTASTTYSRLFTEFVELLINFSYVFVLSRKKATQRDNNAIAPTSEGDLKVHGAAYRLYSLAFPLLHAIAQLDRVLFFTGGYAVVVQGEHWVEAPMKSEAPARAEVRV